MTRQRGETRNVQVNISRKYQATKFRNYALPHKNMETRNQEEIYSRSDAKNENHGFRLKTCRNDER